MPPKINLTALKAMEAAFVAQAAEKKKKRLVIRTGQYELKHLRKGPRTDLVRVKYPGQK